MSYRQSRGRSADFPPVFGGRHFRVLKAKRTAAGIRPQAPVIFITTTTVINVMMTIIVITLVPIAGNFVGTP
jgi:hypothetical protein